MPNQSETTEKTEKLTNTIELLRSLRSANNEPQRGIIPSLFNNENINSPFAEDLGLGVGIFILSAIGAFILLLIFHSILQIGIFDALGKSVLIGLAATWLYYLLPIFFVISKTIKTLKWPDKPFIERFKPVQKTISVFTLAYGLTLGLNYGYAPASKMWQQYHLPFYQHLANKPIDNSNKLNKHGYKKSSAKFITKSEGNLPLKNSTFFWVWLLCSVGLAYLLAISWRKSPIETEKAENFEKQELELIEEELKPLPLRLWLGTSTGKLSNLSHGSGIAPNQSVTLNLQDASQNILVLGGIGSGKTTCVMQPLLLQCLDQNCGGLIFDIKGDVKNAVAQFTAATNKELIVLGPKHAQINLLEGLTPEVAASFLKSAFLLSGKANLDSFWIDTASELCRNTLGFLSFLPQCYNLKNLYQYLFDLESQEKINDEIDALLPTLGENQSRLLKTYRNYNELIFSQFDAKIKSGVNATVAQTLAPFNHPDLMDAFCSSHSSTVKIKNVLRGTIYLVDMPLSTWGLGGKVAYTFIKLRFFNLMQNRNLFDTVGKNSIKEPVFFMCDEFQEIVSANRDGLSDLNFWDKSRSSKTIGIISAQAISSFYAAIGDRDIANALLQNFRQKICFRTEDTTTLNYFHSLADKVEVSRKTESWSSGESKKKEMFGKKTVSNSHSTNITYVDKPVLDAQLFRSLNPNQALALLSINGRSMDDVLILQSVYVD